AAKVLLSCGRKVKGRRRFASNSSATFLRKSTEWTSLVRIRSAFSSKKMNTRSEPFVQNTQPFIRRESAFASLAQKLVHIRLVALQNLKLKIPELLDRLGLSDVALIEKRLKPLLSAQTTKFFQR